MLHQASSCFTIFDSNYVLISPTAWFQRYTRDRRLRIRDESYVNLCCSSIRVVKGVSIAGLSDKTLVRLDSPLTHPKGWRRNTLLLGNKGLERHPHFFGVGSQRGPFGAKKKRGSAVFRMCCNRVFVWSATTPRGGGSWKCASFCGIILEELSTCCFCVWVFRVDLVFHRHQKKMFQDLS